MNISEQRPSAGDHETRCADILEGLGDSFYSVDGDWRLTYLSGTAADFLGVDAPDVLGRSLWEVFPSLNGTLYEQAYRRAMVTRKSEAFEAPSTVRPAHRLEVRVFPVLGGLGMSARDVTERHLASLARWKSEARLAAILQQTTAGMAEVDLQGTFLTVNDQYCRLVGRSREELVGKMTMQGITHPDDVPRNLPLFMRAVEAGEPFEIEKRYVRPDKSVIHVNNYVSPIRTPDGEIASVVAVVLDLTERKRAEEHQRLLINELNHRVKNNLALVQSIVRQTLKGSGLDPQLEERLGARLQALAYAHDLLTKQDWRSADMADVVSVVMQPHGGTAHIEIEGRRLALTPKAAVAFSLILHELATNAAKYGALAQASGSVSLNWKVVPVADGDRFELHWVENQSPSVPEAQRNEGFGLRMIRMSVAEFGGNVRLGFEPTGLRLMVEVPAHEIRQAE